MSVPVVLPEQLAPSRVAQIEQLLSEVRLARAPRRPVPRGSRPDVPRCVVCHQAGRLGGHHEADGSISWIHRSCHRRLHLRHLPKRAHRLRLA